jgi:hypothetical protein
VQRLAHPHEHEIPQFTLWCVFLCLQDLGDDFPGAEVPREARLPGRAKPTWVLTQAVFRPLYRMSTVSTVSPSGSRKRNFRVNWSELSVTAAIVGLCARLGRAAISRSNQRRSGGEKEVPASISGTAPR